MADLEQTKLLFFKYYLALEHCNVLDRTPFSDSPHNYATIRFSFFFHFFVPSSFFHFCSRQNTTFCGFVYMGVLLSFVFNIILSAVSHIVICSNTNKIFIKCET